MKRLFLYKVYKFNKTLFIVFILFAGLTLICNITGKEMTPFYVWGIYSEKEEIPAGYEIFRVTANNNVVDYSNGFLPENRLFLQSPLQYYQQTGNTTDPLEIYLKKKLKGKFSFVQPYASGVFNSKEQIEEFPSWYKRYLQQSTGHSVKKLKVEVLNAFFDIHNNIKINSVHTLINE